MNDYVVGIDIGSSKVCAAVGYLDKYSKLQIVGVTSVNCTGLKKGVVVDIDSTAEAIINCVQQLERMVDTKISNAYISLPGGIADLVPNSSIVAISSEDREIKTLDIERVKSAVKSISVSSDKEVIGVIPQQYIVDGFDRIKDPLRMSGYKLELQAQVVVAQTTVVNNIFKSVNRAKINVKGIVLKPIAISQVVLRKEEMDMGVAILDVGAQTMDISVYKHEKLVYTDMIPLGGDSITNDISVCLKLPFSQAEKLKIKYASVTKESCEYHEKIRINNIGYDSILEVDYGMLSQIISARVEELISLVALRLEENGYYEEISEVVIVGGGIALIKGISDLCREILHKTVRIGSPDFVGAASPIYSTAVGIVKDVANSTKNNNEPDNFKEYASESAATKSDDGSKNEKTFISKIRNALADFF